MGVGGVADDVDRDRPAQGEVGEALAHRGRARDGDVVDLAAVRGAHVDLTGPQAARDVLDRGADDVMVQWRSDRWDRRPGS